MFQSKIFKLLFISVYGETNTFVKLAITLINSILKPKINPQKYLPLSGTKIMLRNSNNSVQS